MITLQQILDALAENGDVAALLSGEGLDSAGLAALESEALAAFDGLRAGEISDEVLAQLNTLADGVEAIRAEQGRRETIAAERQTQMEELANRVTPPAAGAEEDTEDGTDPAAVEGDPAPVEGDPAPAEDPELVSASAIIPPARPRARVNLGAVAARRTTPAPPAAAGTAGNRPWSMVAAANVPGISAGDAYGNIEELTAAAVRRFNTMPGPGEYVGRIQNGLAIIRKDFPDELVASGNNDMEVLEYASRESRLAGNSLVAAGGWCAPSEVLYDLCEIEARTGLINIPEIVAARGGIRWTTGPDFSTIFTSTGFIQTEAEAIAGTLKPCYEVPCADFEEVRLDAIGVCISAGLLQARAYSELVERTIRGALTAHIHRYSGQTIARMVAGSTAVAVPGGPGATASILGAVELQVWDYRYKWRMDDNATLEAVFPLWIKGAIRSDLAKRNGFDNPLDVTDAMIMSWFALRGVAVQFVYNFQDAYSVVPGPFGGAVPATAWPATVQWLLYAAGTWVRLTQDIIDLSAVYDSTLFRVNKYNALFTEEGLAVAQVCAESRIVTTPFCPDGASGEQRAQACPIA